jgi:hypothetical protein
MALFPRPKFAQVYHCPMEASAGLSTVVRRPHDRLHIHKRSRAAHQARQAAPTTRAEVRGGCWRSGGTVAPPGAGARPARPPIVTMPPASLRNKLFFFLLLRWST